MEENKAYWFYCSLFIGSVVLSIRVTETMKTLVMMLSQNWVLTVGRMHTRHFQTRDGKIHNQYMTVYEDFDNQRKSVKHKVRKYNKDVVIKYETHLDTSLGIVSFLTLQGEPFHGHDESTSCLNKGNLIEMLD